MTDQPVKINANQGFEQFLVDNGFVKPETLEDLRSAEKQTGQNLSQLLVTRKILEEEDLTKAKAAFFNIPYVDLKQAPILPSTLALIPQEAINFYNFVPFELKDKTLKVAITNPGNLSALEALEFLGQKQNLQVQLYLASESSIEIATGKKKNLKRVVGEALKNIQIKADTEQKPATIQSVQPQVIEDAPIIKIVEM